MVFVKIKKAIWGKPSELSQLTSANLMRLEIKQTKKCATRIGRWIARSALYKQCESDGQLLLKDRLADLKQEEEARKLEGMDNKKLYREKQAEIRKGVKETVALAKRQAWYPDQLKIDLELRLKEINESQIFSDAEKEEQKKQAKKEHEKKLADFYNNAKRIARIKAKYKNADMHFTQTEKICIFSRGQRSNLVAGGSDSDRVEKYLHPNILQANTSFVIVDSDGRILENVGYFLEKIKGYKIRVLNLDEKTQSDGYNPFIYIHPERAGYEERIMALVESLFANTGGYIKKDVNKDPFWANIEKLFLQSIFFFATDGFVPEERNMNTVMKLVSMLEISEYEDDYNSDLDVFARIFKEKYGEDHIGVRQYEKFRENASCKTASTIVVSVLARLSMFEVGSIKKMFSYDSMHLDRVGEEKRALFIIPSKDASCNFIAEILLTQLFQELQYCATQVHKHDGCRIPVPCHFFLNSTVNIGIVPGLQMAQILSQASHYGITISVLSQSIEEANRVGGAERSFLRSYINDLLCLDWKNVVELDRLGYTGMQLLNAKTYKKWIQGESCLLVKDSYKPFLSKAYNYRKHPNYRFTSDANKEFSYHYTPEPPPEPKAMENAVQVECAYREDWIYPSEQSWDRISTEPIRVEADPVKQLSYMPQNANSLEPIPDEDLIPDDGENTLAQVNKKTLQELLGEEEVAAQAAKESVSEETQVYLDNLKQRKIRMETNLLHMVNHLGRSFRELEIVPDENLLVDNGEETEYRDSKRTKTDSIYEKAAEYIIEEEQASPEELNDIIDDAESLLTDLELDLGDDAEPYVPPSIEFEEFPERNLHEE